MDGKSLVAMVIITGPPSELANENISRRSVHIVIVCCFHFHYFPFSLFFMYRIFHTTYHGGST